MKNITYFQAANLSDSEVISQFVVRKKELEQLLSEIRNDDMSGSIQHYILVGQRGSGKSTLLRRIQAEINTDEKLQKQLIAVNLSEEQAGIYRLHDLWERVCEELRVKDIPVKEVHWEEFGNNLTAYAKALYEAMQQALLKAGKKLVLLLDNIDRILENIKNDDNHLLRELLMNHKDVRIIGGSTRLSEHHWKYEQPFYQFFRIIRLSALSQEEMKELLVFWADLINEPTLKEFAVKYSGKLNAVRVLSDGMPRTMLSLVDLLINKPDQHGYEYLRSIIDRATPIYQERLSMLSPLQQKVVLELSFFWDAVKIKELSAAARMESKTLSAVLNQLVDLQIVEKRTGSNKNMLYLLKERFFNLWLIMTQGGPKQKSRVKWLTIFLETWYEPTELKQIYQRFATDLSNGKLQANHAIVMTKALVHSTAITTFERDSLLDATQKLIGNRKEFAELLPQKAQQIFTEAINLIEENNCDKALQKIEEIEQNEDWKELITGLAFQQKGDYRKAEKHFLYIANRENPNAFFALANLYNETNRKDQAEKYYLKAIEKGDVDALYNLANLYNETNRKDEAEQYYLKAIEKGDAAALYNLAVLYKKNNRKDEAEQYYLKAIEKGDVDALNNLAHLYDETNRNDEAEQYYLKAIEKGHVAALYNLANLYNETNRNDEAEQYYFKAIEKGHVDALNNLANLYDETNRKDEAEQYYFKAIEKGNVGALYNLANLYYETNRKDEAEQYYFKAIEKGDVDALNNLANLYNETNRKVEAEQYYIKAIENGDDAALYNLAILYNETNRKDEAEQYYFEAIEKGNVSALNNLAVLYYEQNKKRTETLQLLDKFKLLKVLSLKERVFSVITNIWAGNPEVLDQSENLLQEAIEHKEVELLKMYLKDLLIHHQTNTVWHYFQHEVYGETLRDMLKPLYFTAARFINNETAKDVLLTQPPELDETVAQIVEHVNERRNFYTSK